MELRHLRYFVTVAEELNFTRAAERLRTAQPSLSQQIRDLEEEIGTPLLLRTKRQVALTEAGRVFLDEARLVLAQAQRAVAEARRAGQGSESRLAIGFVPAAEVKIFPSMLTVMRAEFPQLNLVLRNLTTAEQQEALLNNGIDVAFMREPITDSRLSHEIVLTERLQVVLPADHPLAAKAEIQPADLNGLPFLRITPPHAGSLHQVVENFLQSNQITLQLVQDVENALTLMSLVGMGVGVGFLPDYVEHLLFRNVTSRPLAGPPITINLVMAWRSHDRSSEVKGFRELVHETLGLIAK